MTSMFSKAPPPMPTPPAPPPMPDPLSPASLEAKNLAIQQAQTGGRSSTILTTPATRPSGAAATLAGGYAGTKLGSST